MSLIYSLKHRYISFSVNTLTNKAFTIEATFDPQIHLSAAIDYSTKQDHAGFIAAINIFGFTFDVMFTDKRHWSTELDRWYLPGEEICE